MPGNFLLFVLLFKLKQNGLKFPFKYIYMYIYIRRVFFYFGDARSSTMVVYPRHILYPLSQNVISLQFAIPRRVQQPIIVQQMVNAITGSIPSLPPNIPGGIMMNTKNTPPIPYIHLTIETGSMVPSSTASTTVEIVRRQRRR